MAPVTNVSGPSWDPMDLPGLQSALGLACRIERELGCGRMFGGRGEIADAPGAR